VSTLSAVNPATGDVVETFPEMDGKAISGALEAAAQAQRAWRESSFAQRAVPMRGVAALLRERSREIARLIALEMGKPVRDGIAEAEKCAVACDYFADHAEDFLRPVDVATDASHSFWTYTPLGVVLAIMPWNFPFWQVFRFIAPNLMAGNGGVLKHASNVPGCAMMIEELLRDAGFPKDLFRTLLVGTDAVRAVIADPRVSAVTLTGSVGAGKAVARTAGEHLKKTVLELGGSDPYVVLADADLDVAADTCAKSRLINSGQSCISAKRFIVVGSVKDAFLERFVARMSAARMGDPLDDQTEMGPLAREDLRNDLHEQVMRSVSQGARVVLGGEISRLRGAWYPPTVLVDVRPGMPAYEEELFGPVAAVIEARDEDDALRIANDSTFGLGAAVFTKDVARGERIAAERLDAGNCFVNGLVKSDARLPFGGIKESGYGRELSPFGIREFVNVKTVWVR
jgi:succinate-semialdehyde dehydrogenase/glutarate-semialdehyde dehydrogenase